MRKKIGIIGIIVIVVIIAIIIICVANGNSSSKFNEQFLQYEGYATAQDIYDLCDLLIANADENSEDGDKLPTLKENEGDGEYEIWAEGGTVAKLDLSEYVSTLSEIKEEFEYHLDSTDDICIISFEYSSDTNLIESIILEHIN